MALVDLSPPKLRRGWYQQRLVKVACAITVCSGMCALPAALYIRQWQVVNQIASLGGVVEYNWFFQVVSVRLTATSAVEIIPNLKRLPFLRQAAVHLYCFDDGKFDCEPFERRIETLQFELPHIAVKTKFEDGSDPGIAPGYTIDEREWDNGGGR